jgi:hypothetical protein
MGSGGQTRTPSVVPARIDGGTFGADRASFLAMTDRKPDQAPSSTLVGLHRKRRCRLAILAAALVIAGASAAVALGRPSPWHRAALIRHAATTSVVDSTEVSTTAAASPTSARPSTTTTSTPLTLVSPTATEPASTTAPTTTAIPNRVGTAHLVGASNLVATIAFETAHAPLGTSVVFTATVTNPHDLAVELLPSTDLVVVVDSPGAVLYANAIDRRSETAQRILTPTRPLTVAPHEAISWQHAIALTEHGDGGNVTAGSATVTLAFAEHGIFIRDTFAGRPATLAIDPAPGPPAAR